MCAIAACLAAFTLNAKSAQAEIPIIEPGDYGLLHDAQPVADPRHNSFVMGTLYSADDVDVVSFDYNEGEPFNAQLYVPVHPDLAGFSPNIVLIGPGLPAPNGHLPVELPAGYGAIVAGSNASYVFFDVFTQIAFYPRANIALRMPRSGRYYMAVFGTAMGRSIYALDIGVEETYAPAAIARYPLNWLEVHQSMAMPIWPTPLGISTVVGIGAFFWRKRLR